ncbi:hypothetical protein ABU113_13390, partial [Sphingosinicellaceae bacterium M-36]
MRRLSIVDLAGGHQPMQSPDGRHVIVFNGEIYNHRALRPALEAAGHRFTTHSDTETLLAAYRQWGDDAWLKLEGMYDPPPLNGSTLKYGFDHEGGPQWQTSDTSPTRSSRSFGRLRFC